MNKKLKDVLTFVPFGALFGGAIGYVGSCGYLAFKIGRPLSEVKLTEVLNVAPWAQYNPTLWQHSLYAIGAFALVGMIAMLVVALKETSQNHGTARWATNEELKCNNLIFDAAKVPGPIFGKLSGPNRKGNFISSKDIPHSLVAAPTGSGKGVGVVIPTLLTYPGSVVCLDVKGENFEKTARRRMAMGDEVYKFSPFDPNNHSHCYNPIEYLKELSADFRFTEATRIAHALLVPPGKGAEGFIDSARNVFAATIILAIENGVPTIGHVYDILANGTHNGLPLDDERNGGFNKMFDRLALAVKYPAAKKIFTSLAKIEQKTLSAYMSVLFDSGLGQWKDPFVRRATQRSDFTIHALRETPSAIYIVINPNDMKVLAPLTRLIFQQVVALLQRAEPKEHEQYPVLLLMDEFPALGKMDAITQAMTTIRSYGGRFMIIVQSISNLKETYGNDIAQSYLANCRLQLYMAPADAETPEYVSKAIGDFTRKSRSKSWQSNKPFGSNIQERHEGARLLRPEDFRRLPDDEVVILIQGDFPIRAKKVFYYKDNSLKPLFEGQSGDYPVAVMPKDEQAVAINAPTLKEAPRPVAATVETQAKPLPKAQAKPLPKLVSKSEQPTEEKAKQVLKGQAALLSSVASVEQKMKEDAAQDTKNLLGKNSDNNQEDAA